MKLLAYPEKNLIGTSECFPLLHEFMHRYDAKLSTPKRMTTHYELYLEYFQKDLLYALQLTEAYSPTESAAKKISSTKIQKIPELALLAINKQIEHSSRLCRVLCSIQTKEWPAQGVKVIVDSTPALASIFDQVQLLKSKTCIFFHLVQSKQNIT